MGNQSIASVMDTPVIPDNLEWLPVPVAGSEGLMLKVLRVDEEAGRAVLKARFAPGTVIPRHYHYCRAVAYTVSGSWDYDEGHFRTGDVAYENVGHNHQARSDEGSELFLVFDTDCGLLLDNFMEDGSAVRFGLSLLKQLEGATLEQYQAMDLTPHVQLVPAGQAAQ